MKVTTEEKAALRRKTGVRELQDIDGTVGFRLAYHPPAWVLASIHPAVVAAETLEEADRIARALSGDGHPAVAVESRRKDSGKAAFARQVEDIIRAARVLSHFTGGRTMDMHARGSAVEAAKTAYILERGYFDGFYGEGDGK